MKLKKKIVLLGIGLITLVSVGYFLPQIVSANFGKDMLEAHLESLLGGEVTIKRLSLNWQGQQSCHRVQWIDEKNGIAIEAKSLVISASLMDCLKYKDKPLRVVVEGAKATCKGNLNFLKIYDRTSLKLRFSPITALIEEGKITIEKTEISLTKSVKVFTWGSVNLENSRMDLIVGLPPKTLKKLFKSGNLAKDTLLEIPISTKLSTHAMRKQLAKYFLHNYSSIKALQKEQR